MNKTILSIMGTTERLGDKTRTYNNIEYVSGDYTLYISYQGELLRAELFSHRTLKTVSYFFADMSDFRTYTV